MNGMDASVFVQFRASNFAVPDFMINFRKPGLFYLPVIKKNCIVILNALKKKCNYENVSILPVSIKYIK